MIRKYFIFFIFACVFHITWTTSFVLPGRKVNYSIRASSYPFISGDTFREFCDFIIDETHKPFDPSHVKDGNTIFLKADGIDYFFTKIHPHITARYILITHNSDCGVTRAHLPYLNEENLIAWFAQNAMIIHPKLVPIPIGVANRYWPHGTVSIIRDIAESQHSKKYLAYLNCVITTNIPERKKVYTLFRNTPFCHVASKRPFINYLIDMAQSKFVLSPPGNGLDCHRTWEALYMGAIPIVKQSAMDQAFDDLPVIIVDRWEIITKEFLEKKYEEMAKSSFTIEKMYADYWFDLIKSFQTNSTVE